MTTFVIGNVLVLTVMLGYVLRLALHQRRLLRQFAAIEAQRRELSDVSRRRAA